jgi:Ca2+-binding RTX toxin-like protein
VLVGYTGCLPESLTDSNVVFAAVLSDVTGSYDFVLVQPLDHGAPVGTSDYLDLAFHITATDSDGDHATGSFTVRVDAAGSIGSTGSIDYDNETTGVFVNLDSHKHTYGCQTVAAGRSTDIDGQGPVVGIDKVAGIANARGGSGDDILVGSSGISNTLDGGAGQDLLVVLPDLVVPAGSRTFDRGDGTSEQIDVTGLAGGSDNIHGGSGYDTVRFDLDGVTDKGFLFDGASFPGSLAIDGVERFIGTYGNDVIILPTDYTADDGDVTVKGGKGDDVISGSNNADSLFGGNGDDRISGLGGDDTIRGNRGDDVIWGDAGNDTISGGLGDDTLLGGGGNDHFIYKVGDGHDIIDGGAGNSDRLNVNGNNHNQVFALTATGETGFQIETDGGGTPEIIAIKVEKVVLNVAGGHDSITITDIGSDDTITVTGTTGDFTVDGTNLPEIRVLNTGSLDLDLAGRNGNDTIDASALDSAGSPQTLHVTLDGGAGNDTIAGSNGADTLNGGAGNDILRGGAGNDAIDGGTGMDIIDFSDGTAGIDVALVQSPGNTTVNLTAAGLGTDTYKNIEGIFGTAFADTLHGTALNDYFNGGGGKDTLIGGGGSDTLIGGAGSDTFKWLAGDVAGGSLDTILDFETGAAGDILDLSGVLSGVSGNKADHVRVLYTADNFTQLASAAGAPHAVNGDIRIQVNLSGSAWTDVATIHDTGPNLTPGNEVIKMMLDNSTQQVHV